MSPEVRLTAVATTAQEALHHWHGWNAIEKSLIKVTLNEFRLQWLEGDSWRKQGVSELCRMFGKNE